MKKIIAFFKAHYTEFSLALTTICLVAGIYFLQLYVSASWAIWLAMVFAPFVPLKMLLYSHDEKLYRDSNFTTWVVCMLAFLAIQCYTLGWTTDIIWFAIIDIGIWLIGLIPMFCSMIANSNPYE